jgi:hypothetical protein
MKRIKKVAAGTLLTLGAFFLLLAVYQPFDKETKPDQRLSNVVGCLIFGLPLTGAGGWMAWRLHQQAQKKISDRLQSTFYQLIKQRKGQISMLGFAMEAHLSAEAAKQYLDVKAKEFNATFTLSEDGGVFYDFNEFSALPSPESNEFAALPSPESTVSPSVPHSANYWTLGSKKDDVMRIQGTPTKVTWIGYSSGVEEEFYYGSSTKVFFKKGRVVAYDNYDNTLKVIVGQSSPE